MIIRQATGFFLRTSFYLGVLLLVLYFFQDRLLYQPQRATLDQVRALAATRGLSLWPSDGRDYRGFVQTESQGELRGNIVVFHGNAGDALDRTYYVDALGRLGYRVLLHEYPGYGARQGNPGEAAIAQEACASIRQLKQAYPGPLYLFGESLGAGVAGSVAGKCGSEIDGIVLITPWDTLADLAQAIYWFLPARWLVRDRYDNISNLQGYAGPVAVLMAEYDEIVPAGNTRRLYHALPTLKRLWIFKRHGHNNWPIYPDEGWWQEVMEFIQLPER